jgi:signal transduction histidine kinase
VENHARPIAVRGYVIAVVVTAIALVTRLALSSLLGSQAIFFTFVLAVLVAASYGGLYPGLLATALGAGFGRFFFIEPLHSLRIAGTADAVFLALYLLIGITASWLCGALHSSRRRLQAKQQEIHGLLGDLKKANERKDEFLAILAHELRNPMAALQQAVELLQLQSPFDPELQEAKDIIDRQLQQMTRHVDDLSDVSGIMAGRVSIRSVPVALSEIIALAVESSRPYVDAAGHQLSIELPPEPIPLDADRIRLAQVFQNLLINAAKYTPSGGRLWLSAQCEGSDVCVSVRDNGVGISPEARGDIFEMFTQIAHPTKPAPDGLGIGLALVRRLVELHGGVVNVRSEGVGKGSEFIVTLPVARLTPSKDESRGLAVQLKV